MTVSKLGIRKFSIAPGVIKFWHAIYTISKCFEHRTCITQYQNFIKSFTTALQKLYRVVKCDFRNFDQCMAAQNIDTDRQLKLTSTKKMKMIFFVWRWLPSRLHCASGSLQWNKREVNNVNYINQISTPSKICITSPQKWHVRFYFIKLTLRFSN